MKKGIIIAISVIAALLLIAGAFFGGQKAMDWYKANKKTTITDSQNHVFTKTDKVVSKTYCTNCGRIQEGETPVYTSSDFKEDTGYDSIEFWLCPQCNQMNITVDFVRGIKNEEKESLKSVEKSIHVDNTKEEETTTEPTTTETTTEDTYAKNYTRVGKEEIDYNCPYCYHRNNGVFKVYSYTYNPGHKYYKCQQCNRYYGDQEVTSNTTAKHTPVVELKILDDGNWYYYEDGRYNPNFTGYTTWQNNMYYVDHGKVILNY